MQIFTTVASMVLLLILILIPPTITARSDINLEPKTQLRRRTSSLNSAPSASPLPNPSTEPQCSQCVITGEKITPNPTQPNLNIELHAGVPTRLVGIRTTPFACVDARNEEAVVATPAGDVGEFLLGVDVYGSLCLKADPSPKKITQTLMNFLQKVASPERRFYMHTDNSSLTNLLALMKVDRLPMKRPKNVQAWFAALTGTKIRTQGCGHLFYQLEYPEEYQIPLSTVKGVIQAFYDLLLWSNNDIRSLLFLEVLYSQLNGKAVVTVTSESLSPLDPCGSSTAALVSPRFCNGGCPAQDALGFSLKAKGMVIGQQDVFVNHATAVQIFREEILAPFFAALPECVKSKVSTDELLLEINKRADLRLNVTLSHILKGPTPSFTWNVNVQGYF